MIIEGINFTTKNGVRNTTLHVTDEFNSYYSEASAGRGCVGKKVESIYVGNYDCSNLKVGMKIDILYDKAIRTVKGNTYQPVKRIEILK